MKKSGMILIFIGIVFALISLWWWALLGMKPDVGYACQLTAGILIIIGLLIQVDWDKI